MSASEASALTLRYIFDIKISQGRSGRPHHVHRLCVSPAPPQHGRRQGAQGRQRISHDRDRPRPDRGLRLVHLHRIRPSRICASQGLACCCPRSSSSPPPLQRASSFSNRTRAWSACCSGATSAPNTGPASGGSIRSIPGARSRAAWRSSRVGPLKVNDAVGNPIDIGAIIVWRVEDAAKAMLEVASYATYVKSQSEAALRRVVSVHPYDQVETEEAERQGERLTSEGRPDQRSCTDIDGQFARRWRRGHRSLAVRGPGTHGADRHRGA